MIYLLPLTLMGVGIFSLGLIAWSPVREWRWKRWPPKPKTAEAKSVIALLRDDPKGWREDACVIYHPGLNVGIWIANEAYALHWWHGHRNDHSKVNYNSFYARDRGAVYGAYQRWKMQTTPITKSLSYMIDDYLYKRKIGVVDPRRTDNEGSEAEGGS